MAALPSLRQLNYLVALAEHLNFTRAAAACFVTQSTLSAGLKELESTLGANLVERDRQRVVITPLGAEVAARARSLIAQAEDLVELASGAAEPMSGTLRLGVIPTIAPFLLPRILPGLRAKYPKLKLLLREDLTASLLARLRAAQLDFALIALPYDTGGLLEQPLFDDEFWLAGRAEDPAFKAKRLAVTAPVAERLLLLEEGHCLREHTLAACARSSTPNASGIEATSLLTLVQMVESGIGLALVPEIALKSGLLQRTGLVARPLAPPAPRRTLALVARPSSARTAELQLLADFIVETHKRAERAVLTSRGRRTSKSSAA
ncbi:MAG: LysR family transcriptional regulator [Betaproteobacteria bacterium RIFCSPLOWO2_12_FULL_67_28]|nr:MAG: LysR family transcriptional regulator [Betaproteobacteria bacterium RIFCSPLOWO2_12_FULL_67_28]